ncbi:MAG: LptE family protein [Bacteroidetes bacterium]|nr:LptE family protein [Bacteroidota bacterium]
MNSFKYILLIITTITVLSCGNYSFTGVNEIKADTFQVNYFQNNAPLIEPGLERDFTQALQELIQNQTRLNLVNSNADLVYEGEITEYRISPTTATAQNTAAQNRLTIGVNVRFFDKNDVDAEFEKRFSFYFDYAGSAQLVGGQKDTAIEEIFERITQDIFNASLAKW